MGTGLVAPFYRVAKRLRGGIQDDDGVLRSVARLSNGRKARLASAYHYRARSECALDVASTWPGGDYFEFGSAGLMSFRSFLAAFDLHGQAERFPDTRFYAFDIFGNPDQGSGPPAGQREYFEHWRNPQQLAVPLSSLKPYGRLKDRCVMVPGYFQDTLNVGLKAIMRAENRRIGYAFLDCSIAASYKLVFDFLIDVIGPMRMFIYIDEYFVDEKIAIHTLYEDFAAKAKQRHGLDSLYMRNAGGFGALFCLMPGRA
jgi:hypothetical protein